MKLADLATGPDWIIWTVFVVFAVLSIILLSGHGSWFISGYNMASKEEKESCATALAGHRAAILFNTKLWY